jgi:pimeloyl-ACP methyl ester carboxylesterase
MGSMIWGLLTSPDYKFRDFKAIMVNGCQGNLTLWKEILALDLTDTLRNVNIPYTMLQGDTDIVATTEYVQEIAENSGNPHLQCRIVKDCGHEPSADMMDAVFHALEELAKE